MIVPDDDGKPSDLWFKSAPEHFDALSRSRGFRPAPYLARAKWVALDRFDTLVITAGLFGVQDALATDPARLERLFSVNFTGTALLCQLAAERLAERGGGVICAFSSVAGDRARPANYLYGATKAGLSAFLDGLGLAYADRDVRVVCVRPGFVRTEMTVGLREPPFAGDADTVAAAALRAMDAGAPVVYSPGIWRWIMCAIRALPRFVLRRLRF